MKMAESLALDANANPWVPTQVGPSDSLPYEFSSIVIGLRKAGVAEDMLDPKEIMQLYEIDRYGLECKFLSLMGSTACLGFNFSNNLSLTNFSGNTIVLIVGYKQPECLSISANSTVVIDPPEELIIETRVGNWVTLNKRGLIFAEWNCCELPNRPRVISTHYCFRTDLRLRKLRLQSLVGFSQSVICSWNGLDQHLALAGFGKIMIDKVEDFSVNKLKVSDGSIYWTNELIPFDSKGERMFPEEFTTGL